MHNALNIPTAFSNWLFSKTSLTLHAGFLRYSNDTKSRTKLFAKVRAHTKDVVWEPDD